MRLYLFSIMCILLFGLVGSCTTTPAKVKKNQASFTEQGRIQFQSSTTEHLITVERADPPERIGRGLLNVVIALRNKTKINLWVDVRTTFLDSRGQILEQTNWEPILLDARTVTEYTCTSLGNQAADYQVIIRKPQKSSGMP